MSNLTLEEVSARTGIPIAKLQEQQLAMKLLRAKRPTTQSSPTIVEPKSAPIPYSPTGGPMRLQKALYDSGAM